MYVFIGTSDYLPSADKWLLYIHLSKLIHEHFSNSYFLTRALIILNDFNLIMSISMDQSLEVFMDSFHSFYIFRVQKCKNQRFWSKQYLWCIFIKLNCRCFQLVQATYKNTEHLIYGRFLRIFEKNENNHIFRYF